MLLGVVANINREIDLDTAILVGQEFGVEVTAARPKRGSSGGEIPDREEDLQVAGGDHHGSRGSW